MTTKYYAMMLSEFKTSITPLKIKKVTLANIVRSAEA